MDAIRRRLEGERAVSGSGGVAARNNQLAAALERIVEGAYGTCERCGGPIEAARLAADRAA